MSQFSCQGVSLPGSEEKQGRKKMNLVGTRPRTHGYVWARSTWDAAPSPPALGKRVPGGVWSCSASAGISRLSPASQPGARQGRKPASSLGSSLCPHSSRGDGKRHCGFSREVPRWWRVPALQHKAFSSPGGSG